MVSSVHRPDDPRIREKLIDTLGGEWEIHYATQTPGPSDPSGLKWIPLPGGRWRRWLGAWSLIPSARWDLVAVHDPELLPAAWVRSMLGRASLFDLHENLPAQLRARSNTPSWLRPILAVVAGAALRLTERLMAVTLAEAGYRELFSRPHAVIANHLLPWLPEPQPPAEPPYLAYLGDVTEPRGAFLALEAAAGAGQGLVMVGRVSPPDLGPRLLRRAARMGVSVELTGQLAHREALDRIAAASAGLSPLLDIGNYRHSLPTKIPEYLGIGLPVVASDLPGTRQPLNGLEGVLFVPPGDPVAWREAGARVAATASLRAGATAQVEAVRRRFVWPAEEVLIVYRTASLR